jgi:putative transposase
LRPVRKRKLVDEARGEWGVSIRRACRVLLVDTSTYHYKSRRAGLAGLEQRIKEICQTRVRYGYRRVHVLLRREGWGINQKRTRRIYRELGLQLRNKTPKRRVKAKLREERRNATRPNETWAMDFVHDQLATGRRLRVLTIVDTFSRFAPALEPRFSFRGADVVEVLERAGRTVGLPAAIRVDQGTEFVSRDLDLWAFADSTIRALATLTRTILGVSAPHL